VLNRDRSLPARGGTTYLRHSPNDRAMPSPLPQIEQLIEEHQLLKRILRQRSSEEETAAIGELGEAIAAGRRLCRYSGADGSGGWPSSASVQCVASCGGAWLVRATTRSTVAAGRGGIRDGRVLSRVSPSTPSCMNRSCQRHTTVSPLPIARLMVVVPAPSALRTIIRDHQTCFCGLLRSRMIDCRRARSAEVTSMIIPLRMSCNRTASATEKLKFGLFCSVPSTRGHAIPFIDR